MAIASASALQVCRCGPPGIFNSRLGSTNNWRRTARLGLVSRGAASLGAGAVPDACGGSRTRTGRWRERRNVSDTRRPRRRLAVDEIPLAGPRRAWGDARRRRDQRGPRRQPERWIGAPASCRDSQPDRTSGAQRHGHQAVAESTVRVDMGEIPWPGGTGHVHWRSPSRLPSAPQHTGGSAQRGE